MEDQLPRSVASIFLYKILNLHGKKCTIGQSMKLRVRNNMDIQHLVFIWMQYLLLKSMGIQSNRYAYTYIHIDTCRAYKQTVTYTHIRSTYTMYFRFRFSLLLLSSLIPAFIGPEPEFGYGSNTNFHRSKPQILLPPNNI